MSIARLLVLPLAVLAVSALTLTPAVAGQQDPAGSQGQRDAMARLASMDGEWRGTAVLNGPGGGMTLTQTERVGAHLGGSIRVVEGRGYAADGSTQFNAFAIIGWNEGTQAYPFRAYAQGYHGDYPFEATEDGFRWQTPAGPGATIQYVATIKDGRWHEVGHYVREGQTPLPYIEMDLRRVGDSDWPGAGAVAPTE